MVAATVSTSLLAVLSHIVPPSSPLPAGRQPDDATSITMLPEDHQTIDTPTGPGTVMAATATPVSPKFTAQRARYPLRPARTASFAAHPAPLPIRPEPGR
jgi:hypothetical protein